MQPFPFKKKGQKEMNFGWMRGRERVKNLTLGKKERRDGLKTLNSKRNVIK